MDKIYGLIGNPLGHSYSPQIHAELCDYVYRLFPMEESEVAPFLSRRAFSGINVTIPYKQTVIPLCDRISEEAERIGSVNTIVRESDGTLSGYNTDYFGMREMLSHGKITVKGKKTIVLGSGGSSKTAVCVLTDLGASSVTVISRSGVDNYQNIARHADAQIIVNTTPVGMYPKNGSSPVELSNFPVCEGVADLIYNPEKTKLLLTAEKLGIPNVGGLYMLVSQAAAAAELFTGKKFTPADIDGVYRKINMSMRNIVLIGMPGCGKTAVGRSLAGRLGKSFADCDEYISETTGRTPAEWITVDGEARFREIETEALRKLTALSSTVIATGGGAVTVEANKNLLRQNGPVVFINRPLAQLTDENRPLSRGAGAIEALWRIREPLYRDFSDYEVAGGDGADVVAEKIIKIIADRY